LIHTTVIWK